VGAVSVKEKSPYQASARPRVAEDGIERRQLFASAGLAATSLLAGCGAEREAAYTPAGIVDQHQRRTTIRAFDDPLLETGRLLKEAAEIEHDLMVQYLYAAFSLKPRYADLAGYGTPEASSVLGVAVQEMQHLRAVNDLLAALGFAPVLSRHDFPEEGNIYPFKFKLEPMTRESLAKYVYCEAPPEALVARTREDEAFARKLARALGSDPRPNHVGSLYNSIIDMVSELAAGSDLLAEPDDWLTELRRIKDEGERDHYTFFRRLFDSDHAIFNAQAAPAHDVWRLPKTDLRFPSHDLLVDPTAYPGHPRSIPDADTRRLAWLGNLTYWLILALLDIGYRDRSAALRMTAQGLMQGPLIAIARVLPFHGTGLPFDPLSMGASPGFNRAKNLNLARRLAREAIFIARRRTSLPSSFAIEAFEQVVEMLNAYPENRVIARRG
jgi:hypothetical protein